MQLPPAEVQIWYASLSAWARRMDALRAGLFGDELQRVDHFRLEADRQRFILGRGLLRFLAGRYLQRTPAEVRLIFMPSRKPMLEQSGGLEFNLSHSGDLVLLAFAWNRRVGIDIEFIDSKIDVMSLARQFLSARNLEALLAQEGDAQRRHFYQLWVQAEARLKATGAGLARDHDRPIDVAESAGDHLQCVDLTIARGYAAALAIEADHVHLRVLNADEFILNQIAL